MRATKIAELDQRLIAEVEKMISLLDWMANQFMFGAPALLFANRYFSPNRFRRMIKGLRKKDVQNAAWDLTLLQNWRRAALKGIKGTNPAILMTGDKAVRDVAGRMTAESETEFRRHLLEPWGNTRDGLRILNHYREAWTKTSQDANRVEKVPNYETQLKMIEELEAEVLVESN